MAPVINSSTQACTITSAPLHIRRQLALVNTRKQALDPNEEERRREGHFTEEMFPMKMSSICPEVQQVTQGRPWLHHRSSLESASVIQWGIKKPEQGNYEVNSLWSNGLTSTHQLGLQLPQERSSSQALARGQKKYQTLANFGRLTLESSQLQTVAMRKIFFSLSCGLS